MPFAMTASSARRETDAMKTVCANRSGRRTARGRPLSATTRCATSPQTLARQSCRQPLPRVTTATRVRFSTRAMEGAVKVRPSIAAARIPRARSIHVRRDNAWRSSRSAPNVPTAKTVRSMIHARLTDVARGYGTTTCVPARAIVTAASLTSRASHGSATQGGAVCRCISCRGHALMETPVPKTTNAPSRDARAPPKTARMGSRVRSMSA